MLFIHSDNVCPLLFFILTKSHLIHSSWQSLSSSLYPDKISFIYPDNVCHRLFFILTKSNLIHWPRQSLSSSLYPDKISSYSFTPIMFVIFSPLYPDKVSSYSFTVTMSVIFSSLAGQSLILFIHPDNVCHLFLFIGTKSHSFTLIICHLFPFSGTKSHLIHSPWQCLSSFPLYILTKSHLM